MRLHTPPLATSAPAAEKTEVLRTESDTCKKILELCRAGNAKAAKELGLRLLETEPENPQLNYRVARALTLLHLDVPARDLLKKAVSLEPRNPNYRLALGAAELSLGNKAAASLALQDPFAWEALNTRKSITFIRSLIALEEFQRVSAIVEDTFLRAHQRIAGRTFLTEALQGVPAAEKELHTIAQDKLPHYGTVKVRDLLLIFLQENRLHYAELVVKDLQCRPYLPAHTLETLGYYHLIKGELPNASYYFKKTLEAAPQREKLYRVLGLLSVEQGHIDEAVSYLRNTRLSHPNDISTLCDHAESEFLTGDRAQSQKLLQIIERTTIKDCSSVARVASLYLTCRKPREARTLLERSNPPTHQRDLLAYGRCYFLLDDPSAARPYLEAVLHKNPHQLYAINMLAHVARQEKKWDEASQLATRGYAARPQDPIWPCSKAQILLDQEKPADAETELRKAISLNPTARPPGYLLAFALDRQGKVAESANLAINLIRERFDHALLDLIAGYARAGIRPQDFQQILACAQVTEEISQSEAAEYTYKLEQARRRVSLSLGAASVYGTTVFQTDLKLKPVDTSAAKILMRYGISALDEDGA